MAEKVCAVLGAGPGLGLSVARHFGREGYVPALFALRQESLDEMTAQLQTEGIAHARGFVVNLGDFRASEAALQRVQQETGEIEVLVYNAIAVRNEGLLEITPEDLATDLNVGVVGAFAAIRAVVPAMLERGSGTILITGGGLALSPERAASWASPALQKVGIRTLTFALAPTLADRNIHAATVTIAGMIAPGTPFAPEKSPKLTGNSTRNLEASGKANLFSTVRIFNSASIRGKSCEITLETNHNREKHYHENRNYRIGENGRRAGKMVGGKGS